jgi:ParB family chromosome partitioning protein
MNDKNQALPKPSRLDLVRAGQGASLASLPKQSGLHSVALELLVEDPANERKTYTGMDGMVASVKAKGIVEPLTVTPHDTGKYMILTGHRRFRAAREAGLKEVLVVVTEHAADAADRRRKSIVSNVQREDVPVLELAEALKGLLDTDPNIKTQRKLAELLGKREAWVSEMLKVLDLSKEAKEKLRKAEGHVSYDAVMRVAREKDSSFQEQMIEDLASGKSNNRDVREKIKSKKGGAGAGDGKKKFKEAIRTENATVIVQFSKTKATREEVRSALKEALNKFKE